MAKNKAISPEAFSAGVSKILQDYTDQVDEGVVKSVEEIGKDGVKLLREASKQFIDHGGHYWKSWKSKVETNRIGSTVVLYSDMPYIPHLLEYGHAKRNGGRVPGRAHIKPVEAKLNQVFEQSIKAKIGG